MFKRENINNTLLGSTHLLHIVNIMAAAVMGMIHWPYFSTVKFKHTKSVFTKGYCMHHHHISSQLSPFLITMLTWLYTQLTRLLSCVCPGSIYSPPSPTGLLSDTTSPIYPDRPIRPLPKRRLRSRLSPETANSILYPTAPHVTKPLFYLPFTDSAAYTETGHSNAAELQLDSEKSRQQEIRSGGKKDGYQFRGNDVDSDDDDGVGIIRRYQEQRQALASTPRAFANGSGRSDFSKHINPQISQSTASSNETVDGYDSFENTNNKKKRKIPTSGSLGNHHSTLSAEMAHMGLSAPRDNEASQADLDGGIGQYYGIGNSAIPATLTSTAISGGVRGRYSRVGTRPASGRSPLGVSVNGSNTLQSGRIAFQRRDFVPSASFGGKGN